MSKLVIIDYDAGNLHSVYHAFLRSSLKEDQVIISSDYNDLKSATHVVLPGVGAFGDCAVNLFKNQNLVKTLKHEILVNKKPFLGICVGMQLLATKGCEHGIFDGLDIIKGEVVKIDDDNAKLIIPHMGWNEIELVGQKHPILDGIKNGDHAYFVHSYYFDLKDSKHLLAKVNYGADIPAIIGYDNIVATQSHPEKSGECGLRVLANFLKM